MCPTMCLPYCRNPFNHYASSQSIAHGLKVCKLLQVLSFSTSLPLRLNKVYGSKVGPPDNIGSTYCYRIVVTTKLTGKFTRRVNILLVAYPLFVLLVFFRMLRACMLYSLCAGPNSPGALHGSRNKMSNPPGTWKCTPESCI